MAVTIRRLGYARISSTGGGGASPGYSQSIILGSWTVDSGNYILTIPAAVHGKGTNPHVQAFQSVGSDFEEIIVGVLLSPAGNITITVNQTPDARFSGKIIVQ
jgi:hypothetical protein